MRQEPTGGSTNTSRVSFSTEGRVSLAVSVLLTVGAASSAPFWWRALPWAHHKHIPDGVTAFSGGCDAFRVYAQNRWTPYGVAVRAEPNVDSKLIVGLQGNMPMDVNGWVVSRPAYPTNTAPWNSGVWFHLADDSGWVSFAGVRAAPVAKDPTGHAADGGVPVPTLAKCQGTAQ